MKTAIFTQRKAKTNTGFGRLTIVLSTAFLLFTSISIKAQDVLVGLTSNGGPEGKGTAYSIKTDTKAFSVIKGFADWGAFPVDDLVKGSDGNLYGMTPEGGTYNHGTLFRITNSGEITVLKHFNLNVDGGYPRGSLIQATDGNFYGTLSGGTPGYSGGIFKITPAGQYNLIRSLTNADGIRPGGKLVQGKDGYLYGLCNAGGATGYGSIFKLKTDGSSYTVMKSFTNTDGANPYGGLVQASDGALYGMTYLGGTTNDGVIFRVTATSPYTYTVLRHLNDPDGVYPTGDLIQAKDGYLYGMTPGGGNYHGVILKLKTDGTSFKVVYKFGSGAEGVGPKGSLLQTADGNFWGMTYSTGGGTHGAIFKMNAAGTTITTVKKFTQATEGGYPMGSVVQGSDGALYGMTNSGGNNALGTIFRATTSGSLTVLAHMNGATLGNTPQDNLALGKDSVYFGVTRNGGAYDYGTLFKICGGVTTLVRSFNRNVDGGNPVGSLVKGPDGAMYGMTETGGTNGGGTIYKISSTGSFSVLRHLKNATDGGEPKGTMTFGPDGFLYGVTYTGGTGTGGTIFKVKTDGTSFIVLRSFVPTTDGSNSEGGLVLKDTTFYGMTGYNTRFYKITKSGVFTIIKTLSSSTDGNNPAGSLVFGKDGALYGTFSSGGTNNKGVIFKITTGGTITKLRHLNGTTDGGTPKGGLVQGSDGAFYGTTSIGGSGGVGTIFKIAGTSYSVLKSFNMATDGGAPLGGLMIAPKITLVANAQSVSTNEDVSKAITLAGSGGTNLTFAIVTQPKNGTITSGTAAARTYKPKSNFYGVDSFAFTANVGCLASAPAWVKITVASVNDAPVLAAIGNKTIAAGTKLSFTATATDVDAGQTKTFSLITPPSGATISSTTGAFSWTPSKTGTYTLKVRVTDNGSPVLYDEETITVTVTATLTTSAAAVTVGKQAEVENASKAALYPNPVVSSVTVNLKQPAKDIKLTIVDMKGAVVYTKQYNGTLQQLQVNASGFASGSYIVMLQIGEATQTLRFIKQ